MPKIVQRLGKAGLLNAGVHPRNVSRPHLICDFYDWGTYGVGLSWGVKGHDPLWHIDISMHVPKWLERFLPIIER